MVGRFLKISVGKYLLDPDVLFLCVFRNFKAVLMVFVFKASIQRFFNDFYMFVLMTAALAGHSGLAPAACNEEPLQKASWFTGVQTGSKAALKSLTF